MRICFISHTAWDQGVAEKSLLDLIDVIPSDKIECSVILPWKGPLYKELEKSLLRWRALPIKKWGAQNFSEYKNRQDWDRIPDLFSIQNLYPL